MFKIFIFPFFIFLSFSCSSDDQEATDTPLTRISSPSFEQALVAIGIDTDGEVNGQVLTGDISSVNYLPLNNRNIKSLAGLENFIELRKLECANNQLTSLDVSQNITLKELDFSNNLLTNVDVSKNIALTSLVCFSNKLTTLDLSQNELLATLACTNNQLTSLDLSQNTLLTQLYCSENQLASLDVSKNADLIELFCFENKLTALDISQNFALGKLYGNDNQLTSLNAKNGHNDTLKEFNISGNEDLQCIQVDNETAANTRQAPYNVWITNDSTAYSENCSLNE